MKRAASDPEIERLIKRYGSKRALQRALAAAGAKGERGRPKGTQKYLEADFKKLADAELLQTEYQMSDLKRSKRRRSSTVPKRRKLVAMVIPENAAQAGLGMNKDAAVARVAKRRSTARVLVEEIRQRRPEFMQFLPADIEARLRAAENDPNRVNLATVFEFYIFAAALHQRHPDQRAKVAAQISDPEERKEYEAFSAFLEDLINGLKKEAAASS